jgi:hypothetical protein
MKHAQDDGSDQPIRQFLGAVAAAAGVAPNIA